MPTVSVVMAVYNAQDTIVRAVRSVLDQTHTDLELLLVDDASTDASVETVRAHLAERGGDGRVRYLTHPTNRRAAAARNTGVAAATGEFVAFVDSDDEMLPGYLETLVGALDDDVDVVVGNVVYVRPDGSRRERHPAVTGDFAGSRAAELGLYDKITPFTCDKLLRRSLYDGVTYPEGIINEDFLTNPVLASRARTVRVVDAPVYLYRVRADSVTWGSIPPVSELDTAEQYLRDALLSGPGSTDGLRAAVDHAMVFLTLTSAQRALLKEPATVRDTQVVRDCRRRIRWSTLVRLARRAPATVAGAVLLKTTPPAYAWLYRRHVRASYGQDA
ncbi:glycosyltransferase family 2 protein [Sanguibacter inulinus]|uniref:Glycosyltransferase family 2 protein n=1 Tax=Sanguibacter inulinus TaxID=60922 RepID=A0A853EV76_9MICO|nr:glycosyltransferase family 2 protein [Sanguibacter inulinus]MBF0723302.1 glycosyltransferase family 2 protein [Sanguibacter inulinus]NYS94447.1 glycosyltransferase family 2 protein [Sanguibacter inulinus]